MILNFITDQKNSISLSGSLGGTSAGLEIVHTAKSTLMWASPNTSYSWIKLNVYDIEVIDNIKLTYTGNLATMLIERSIDNFNWETLSAAFLPDETILDIDYTSQTRRDFKFIRITINAPITFVLTSLSILTNDKTYKNERLISHNLWNYWSPLEIENSTALNISTSNRNIFPELQQQIFRMLEGNNDLDLRKFDSTIYTNSNITGDESPSGTLTLTPNNIPVITDALYIWDFDDTTSGSTTNIITTENPITTQVHTYNNAGFFVPRLIIHAKTYMLEFTTSFTKT